MKQVTLSLPIELVERIEEAASRGHQPPSQVVERILDISLPPLNRRHRPALKEVKVGQAGD